MMANLSLVWEFKIHGEEYGATLAHDLMSDLNWKDQLSLLLRQSDDQRLHCSALGVLWNRCLREMAIVIFRNWANDYNQHRNNGRGVLWKDLYEEVFEQFNAENLNEIESALEEEGLESLLKAEQAASGVIENISPSNSRSHIEKKK